MRKLIALLALLCASPAWAFTYGTVAQASLSGTTVSVSPSCGASGSDMVVFVTWNPGGGTIGAPTVSDGTGYTQGGSTLVSGASVDGAIYYRTSVSSGSHTITATFSSATAGLLAAYCIGGAGAFDGAAGNDSSFAGTGTNAVLGGSVTTTAGGDSVNGFFSVVSGSGTLSVGTSPGTFTTQSCTGTALCETYTQASSGAIQASATSSASSEVIGFTVAFKSSGGSTCTHAGWTSTGSVAVPTAGSTVVWLKNGSFTTVDCATVNYWQPALGNFGVN